MPIGNLLGLYAFLAIIPLVILYLRKPKPIDQIIPSLMFLSKELKKAKQHSILQKFTRNLLFLIHLLIISLLAFAVAEPYLQIPHNVTVRNTVLILDASASMQTMDGVKSRFDTAIEKARNNLKGDISVIRAGDIPEVMLEKEGKSAAISVLHTIHPGDGVTNLEAAMFEAEKLLGSDNAHVIIISDFLTEHDDQILKARRILSSKDNNVEFIDVSSHADNVGITEMSVTSKTTRIFVKNFMDEQTRVLVKHEKDDETIEEKAVTVLADSIEIVDFDTVPGKSIIRIDGSDDFMLDNLVYVSAPEKQKIKILLITNTPDSNLQKALEATPEFEIEVRRPPIIEAYNLYHDVIIFNEVAKKNPIIPPDIRDIKDYLAKRNRSALIITAQDDLDSVGLNDLLPFTLGEKAEDTRVRTVMENRFTKDITFGVTEKHYTGTASNDTIVLLEGDDRSPLLTYERKEYGQVIYYGLFDDESDFKLTKDYPVFWNRLISYLIYPEDISTYNKKIGDEGFYSFDSLGFYQTDDNIIAVNLLDETESDVNSDIPIDEKTEDFYVKSNSSRYDYSIVIPLLIVALVLLTFELFFVKRRGEF